MNRVLRRPPLASDARAIGGAHVAGVDVAAVADELDRAYEEGRRAGRAETEAAAAQLGRSIDAAAAATVNRLEQVRAETVQHWLDTAIEIAEFLVDSVPDHAAQALVGRIHEALAAINDSPLEIVIGPSDLELVDQALAGRDDITVTVDQTLRPGEARIAGESAQADMETGHVVLDRGQPFVGLLKPGPHVRLHPRLSALQPAQYLQHDAVRPQLSGIAIALPQIDRDERRLTHTNPGRPQILLS